MFVCAWSLMGIYPTACRSTDTGVGQSVLDSAQQIGELSEQNRQLTERVEREQKLREQLRSSIERAESDANQAGDDLRGAIELLKEYKRYIDEYFRATE